MNWNWMMIWNENECGKKTKEMRISRQPSPLQTITDQTQLENVAYSNYFGNITNDARCTHGIKPRTAMAKAAFNRKKTFFYQQTWLKPKKKKPVKCYIWSTALYGAKTLTLRTADQKFLESFEMWCWRRIQKICWTDRVRNEEVLHTVKEEKTITYDKQKEG